MTRGAARKYISDAKSGENRGNIWRYVAKNGKIRSNARQKRRKPAKTGNENEIEKETKV